jgi:hypothetical protein
MHEVLDVPRPGDADDTLAGWPPAFEVPGLISNGKRPTTSKALLLDKGVSVAAKFNGAGTQCAPSRNEHVQSRSKPKPP